MCLPAIWPISILAMTLGSVVRAGEEHTFGSALETHLAALRARDFAAFDETLPERGKLTLILPDGKRSESAEEFRSLHREWFQQGGWTMTHEILEKRQTGDLGFALVKADYREAEREGKPYRNQMYINMVFEMQGDKWVLVFDQCTAIQSE